MLADAVRDFDLIPAYDLKLMRANQTLFDITASLVTHLKEVMASFKPDLVLVQGDTTTAFVGALAAYYVQALVGHVEAGLRTDNKYAPFPEEMNRRLVSALTDYHFAPTERAKKALLNEGISEADILVTGNTVIDALLMIRAKIQKKAVVVPGVESVLQDSHKIVLITGHRRESFGEGFKNICRAIQNLAEKFQHVNFIYPVHLNPNVQKPVYSFLNHLPNIHLIPPLSYIPFVKLMDCSHLILTDSGGIQEEAPSLGKPVLVMRDVTERRESVDAGSSILVGTDPDKIVSHVSLLLTDEKTYQQMKPKTNPYGDGKASNRIADFIANRLQ